MCDTSKTNGGFNMKEILTFKAEDDIDDLDDEGDEDEGDEEEDTSVDEDESW